MSDAAVCADDHLEAVRADLAAKPDGVLEAIAERHALPLQAVLDCLPAAQACRVPGERFEEIWRELTTWGETMLIVHTRDGVFECKTRLPPGEAGRGYFNIHGPDSPLGGHIRADRCRWIYFVDRSFFGKRSCSLQFVSIDGDAMFKVFVARDSNRNLRSDQLSRFEELRRSHDSERVI